ncbi:MAG: hypothetical protein AAFR58_05720, partial [Cyanobacteria bacterium J06627_28]
YWSGKSQTHMDLENEFLNLITCLEVFFTPPGGDPISSTIAESVALWLGSNLEERIKIRKRIKKLYTRRSEVSHGSTDPIKTEDLAYLQTITINVMKKMIERRSEISEKEDIGRLIDNQKLG